MKKYGDEAYSKTFLVGFSVSEITKFNLLKIQSFLVTLIFKL